MNSAQNRNAGHRQQDRGAILMVVLIVMIALLGLGMTGLFLTSGSIQMNTNINLRNQALVVAEAGIERARGVLNNPNWLPPIPGMLTAFGTPTANEDDIPGNTASCQGEARGAVLVDKITEGCQSAVCKLKDVPFPSLDRTSDLPNSALKVARPTMGTYTVFIRQDPGDCRMGNFTCERVSVATATGTGTASNTAVGTDTATTCSPPVGLPAPNGSLVVRSEGLASDGKTRVVLEVTMTPSWGATQPANVPLSALCAAGAAGCDDNASVQNGIVVNSDTPQTPQPPPNTTNDNTDRKSVV